MSGNTEATPPIAKKIKKNEFAGASSIIQLAGVGAAIAIWYYGYQETTSPLKLHDPHGNEFLPWLILGLIPMVGLVLIGSRMATKYICESCGNRLADKAVKICPTCRATFK